MLDSMFLVPLLTGLSLALLLPLLGCLLRLRGEWLAALGLAHVSGAAALAGLALHLPAMLGAGVGALIAAATKALLGARGNTAYGLMILSGWTLMLLIAANTPLGQAMAHAMADGQLYFADGGQLATATAVLALGLASNRWLTARLMRSHLLPEDDRANRRPSWRWHFGFDLLAALALAMATTSIGLMGAFALVFLPPWAAFAAAESWIRAVRLSAVLGVLGYLLAFQAALWLDQPFGPTLVAVQLVLCGGTTAAARARR